MAFIFITVVLCVPFLALAVWTWYLGNKQAEELEKFLTDKDQYDMFMSQLQAPETKEEMQLLELPNNVVDLAKWRERRKNL